MSDLITRLRADRSLTLRERTRAMRDEAPAELLELIDARRLNWREEPLLLALALSDDDDWEKGAPGANELGAVLKQRTDDLIPQLDWLRRKGLVEDNEDGDQIWWQPTQFVDDLLGPSVTT
jgi:hypothetical protein